MTKSAGLDALRNRRTFSASFVDLAVVADFSGLDLYRNKGEGTFENETAKMVDQRQGIGMSHTFDDWNGDGKSISTWWDEFDRNARRLSQERSGF